MHLNFYCVSMSGESRGRQTEGSLAVGGVKAQGLGGCPGAQRGGAGCGGGWADRQGCSGSDLPSQCLWREGRSFLMVQT